MEDTDPSELATATYQHDNTDNVSVFILLKGILTEILGENWIARRINNEILNINGHPGLLWWGICQSSIAKNTTLNP